MAVSVSEQTERNAQGILNHLHKYLLARFRHANRMDPRFGQIEGDLIWHELEAMRKVLLTSKPYAEFRYFIADVLMSFDTVKKHGLFSTSDMNCLLSSVVTETRQVDTEKTGVLHIRDMRGLYRMMDSSLDQVIELIQIWIWWDLLDAAEMNHFDAQAERIANMAPDRMNERVAAYYRSEMRLKKEAPNPTFEEVRDFEFQRTAKLLESMADRLRNEEIYQEMIGYEESEDHSVDQMIRELAERIVKFERLHSAPALDEASLGYYSRMLNLEVSALTPERVLEFERRFIEEAKIELREALQNAGSAGRRYNYKRRQHREALRRLEQLRQQMGGAGAPGAGAIVPGSVGAGAEPRQGPEPGSEARAPAEPMSSVASA